MRCGSVVVAIALAACVAHPTGLELVIEPGQPGDTVELYFGTTKGADPISISGFAQYAITGATYYASDQLTPHPVTTKTGSSPTRVTVEQPAAAPALSFVLALEQSSDGSKYAAAATVSTVDTVAGALNGYTLTLMPVRADLASTTAAGPFAAVWQPDPTRMAPDGDDECEYFNGSDDLGNALNVAIVVDTDTSTGSSTPYADHDCDGFPHRDAANPNAEECDDTVYDAVGARATLQTATCAGMYTQSGTAMAYCYATAQVCTDGRPEAGCPTADQQVDADNVTNYCAPTAFCNDCPTNLGCTNDPTQGPAPYASCAVYYEHDGSDVCDGYSVTFPLPVVASTLSQGMCDQPSPPYIQIGLPGEGFSTQLDINDHGRQVTVTAGFTPDCASATLMVMGTWMPPDTTILLAVSPMGTRGAVLALDLTAVETTDPTCPALACTISPIDDDLAFDACISEPVPAQ